MLHKNVIAASLALALSQVAFAQDDAKKSVEGAVPVTSHQQDATKEELATSPTDTHTGSQQTLAPTSHQQNVITDSADSTETSDMALMETYQIRASDLLGAEVENSQDEDIGEVDDLIIGDDGKMHAVLSIGGFLGIGDHRVVVPYDELQISREEEDDDDVDVIYNVTKAELEGKQAFKYREGDMSWRERVQSRMGDWKDKASDSIKKVTE